MEEKAKGMEREAHVGGLLRHKDGNSIPWPLVPLVDLWRERTQAACEGQRREEKEIEEKGQGKVLCCVCCMIHTVRIHCNDMNISRPLSTLLRTHSRVSEPSTSCLSLPPFSTSRTLPTCCCLLYTSPSPRDRG
eukprot:3868147-Rhodomonas_salina.3